MPDSKKRIQDGVVQLRLLAKPFLIRKSSSRARALYELSWVFEYSLPAPNAVCMCPKMSKVFCAFLNYLISQVLQLLDEHPQESILIFSEHVKFVIEYIAGHVREHCPSALVIVMTGDDNRVLYLRCLVNCSRIRQR